MAAAHRCHVCGDRFDADRSHRCRCGQQLHDQCTDYHATYECRDGEERWIGAVEF